MCCEVFEGTTYVIGQHAFPLEKQTALAVPEEKKGMTVTHSAGLVVFQIVLFFSVSWGGSSCSCVCCGDIVTMFMVL